MANDAILLIDERLEFLRGTEAEIRQLRTDRKILVEARKAGKAEGNGGEAGGVPRHDLAAQIQALGADSLLPPGTVISTTVQGGPPVSEAKVRARNAAVEKQRKPRQKGVKEAVLACLRNNPKSGGLSIAEIAASIPAEKASVRAALVSLAAKSEVVQSGQSWKSASKNRSGNAQDEAAA